MKAISLETNRRGRAMTVAKVITLQETQGLKEFILRALVLSAGVGLAMYILSMQIRVNTLEAEKTSLISSNSNLNSKIATLDSTLTQTKAEYDSTIISLRSDINSSNNVIETLDSEVSSLVTDNKSLAMQYDELLGKYNGLASREELYDKYEYVVTYGGKRTDVTYSQIKMAEDLMLENNYDPHILLSALMVESRGDETAKNPKSTARGYGQFLAGTGKYVYEDMMENGKGTYDHSMALNGNTNIKMMSVYFDSLLDSSNGNLFKTIKNYSGRNDSDTREYMSWMNDFSSIAGINIYNIGYD